MHRTKIVFLAFALIMIFGALSPAFAEVPVASPYTITTGRLGGADYVLYMPQDWNGRLIMGCPGYNFFQDPHPEFAFDALARGFASNGYAFAVSNYNGGERAWLTDIGIIRVHQLTEYLIDNYHITDKIFLLGHSMGGGIALLLGEKYPMLYSGVLDICGNKGAPYQWEYAQIFLTHTVPEVRAILNLPLSVPDSQITGLQTFFSTIIADKIEYAHGTPDERPQVYARENTLLHADVRIPVISVVGGKDPIVPMQAHLGYQAAIAAVGQSDLYRMYVVPNGGHNDAPTFAAVPGHLMELIAWSDSLD